MINNRYSAYKCLQNSWRKKKSHQILLLLLFILPLFAEGYKTHSIRNSSYMHQYLEIKKSFKNLNKAHLSIFNSFYLIACECCCFLFLSTCNLIFVSREPFCYLCKSIQNLVMYLLW